ncbi:MAG: type I-D CRISPR-associated protein Cas5/Csc1 [Spirulinaceae cyanobacterium RM2_2_10]|nr:type I-D CRISPR-associated protein Cas5/Csc1 [Spirulinaceae cyanobacterium SM2_1_0]NJO19956.1 type I-D CRISPR-associated protein Cas5/Csc1 [Spirulinaceae cyanobacterium RM2_2_10]
MTIIYRCQLELHDNLYFATREIGRLYETEPVIHNYALCYALGLVDSDRHGTCVDSESEYRYFCSTQVPSYEAHLTRLNEAGIYVTPARALRHAAVLHTWKYADNRYHVEMKKTQKNIPSFGRAKEIAPESQFECFIIAQKALSLPRWIRLGKWSSKASVVLQQLPEPQLKRASNFTVPLPLNPLDVMFGHRVLSFDTINMPPVSLIQNSRLYGDCYVMAEGSLCLPAQMEYRFR